ncbi:unnamed protein product [Schistosoma haematobium]|nr:unnamed protein product [Schistosoma haematobium]
MPHCGDTQITTQSITNTIYHVLATATTESILIHISLQVQYLFVIFLITLDVICSQRPQANPGLSEKDKKDLALLKKTPEFQKVKAKIMALLDEKIDKFVLDQIRNK